MTAIQIPERFIRALVLHLVKNISVDYRDAPMILGIHGPPGEGKTLQCELTLESLNVRSFRLSGGEFEDRDSGEPARRLRSAYIAASRYMVESGSAACLIVNDIDTGIGDFGELVQYTVNRQTVSGELMSLADGVAVVDGNPVRRVPIVLTANDLTKLYRPLLRLGRMAPFYWKPSTGERIGVVAAMYGHLDHRDAGRLVHEFADEPVSFFSHLRAALTDDLLWTEAQRRGRQELLAAALDGEVLMTPRDFDLEHIVRKGHEMRAAIAAMGDYSRTGVG